MSGKIQLNVLLPKNRDHAGFLRFDVDGVPQGQFRVLGRGSATLKGKPTGNPSRSPFRYAGNTPTGTYLATALKDTSGWDQKSYGPWGALQLKPVGGAALIAQDIFGRDGFLIHGGHPGRFDGFNSTLGCLRVSNDDMKSITSLISNAGDQTGDQMCEDVSITVIVLQMP